jgi:hypothetical protein
VIGMELFNANSEGDDYLSVTVLNRKFENLIKIRSFSPITPTFVFDLPRLRLREEDHSKASGQDRTGPLIPIYLVSLSEI